MSVYDDDKFDENDKEDKFSNDDDDLELEDRCKPAASYKNGVLQERDLKIPFQVLRILLGKNYPDVGSIKSIRDPDRRKLLLKCGRQLKSQGLTFDEILCVIWIRSIQRCRSPLESDALEEITNLAMTDDQFTGNPENISKQFKKWRFSPTERRLYYEEEFTIKLHEHQVWSIELLIDQTLATNDEAVRILNNKLKQIRDRENKKATQGLPARKIAYKKSIQLRDWAFKNGNLADHLFGKGRLISTGDGEVKLNWDWNPYDDPVVGEKFIQASSK